MRASPCTWLLERDFSAVLYCHFTSHFYALEREMAAHSSVPAWRIPGTGSLAGCRLWGRTESTRLKRLSSSTVTISRAIWKWPSWYHVILFICSDKFRNHSKICSVLLSEGKLCLISFIFLIHTFSLTCPVPYKLSLSKLSHCEKVWKVSLSKL